MTLREWMDKNEMMSKSLAEILGISISYMSSIVSGLNKPGPRLAKDIAIITKNKVLLAKKKR